MIVVDCKGFFKWFLKEGNCASKVALGDASFLFFSPPVNLVWEMPVV